MTKMLTKKLVTKETVLDKQPRHALYPSTNPQLCQWVKLKYFVQRNIKASDSVDYIAVNPVSSPRELRLYYSLGHRRTRRALTPLGEHHCGLY